MSRTPTLVVLLLAGCDLGGPPPSGTSVGNPGKTYLTVARTGDGLTFDTASAEGISVHVIGCDEAQIPVLAAADTAPLLDGDALPVPAGTWCGLAVDLTTFVAAGAGPEDDTFTVTLAPAAITLWVEQPEIVDETDYVLELGTPGWLTAEDLPAPGDGGVSNITPESEIGTVLALDLAESSAWYADDGDGVLDETERSRGPVAAARFPAIALGADDTGTDRSVAFEGCGNCTTGGSPSSLGGLGAVLLWLRARRRTAERPTPAGC